MKKGTIYKKTVALLCGAFSLLSGVNNSFNINSMVSADVKKDIDYDENLYGYMDKEIFYILQHVFCNGQKMLFNAVLEFEKLRTLDKIDDIKNFKFSKDNTFVGGLDPVSTKKKYDLKLLDINSVIKTNNFSIAARDLFMGFLNDKNREVDRKINDIVELWCSEREKYGFANISKLSSEAEKEQETKKVEQKILKASQILSSLRDVISSDSLVNSYIKYAITGLTAMSSSGILMKSVATYVNTLLETIRAKHMDKLAEQRRKAAQERYDSMRSALYSNSSINYSKNWKDIEAELNSIKLRSPHNKEPINNIVELLGGYFATCKIQPSRKCLVMSMDGTPGCGKSMFCEEMARVLGASNPVKLSYADFDPSDKDLSIRKQVSGLWHVGDQERGYLAYGKLVSALKHNKHPFVIFDELDKLPKEVISILWDAADTGRININGEDINCEGAIFVLPTNKPLSEMQLGDATDSNMIGKALTTRVHMFHFNKPREEDYKTAINRLLINIKKSSKENYGLELVYENSIVEWISKECVKRDIGMRAIPLYENLIMWALQKKYDSLTDSETDKGDKKVSQMKKVKLEHDEKGNLVCNDC